MKIRSNRYYANLPLEEREHALNEDEVRAAEETRSDEQYEAVIRVFEPKRKAVLYQARS